MKNKEETVLITAVDNGSTVELEINTTLPHEETKEMLAGAVQIQIKDNTFKTSQYQKKLANPTRIADSLLAAATELLLANDALRVPARLVGMTACDLTDENEGFQLSFDFDRAHAETMEQLGSRVDGLRDKYGKQIIRRASQLNNVHNEPKDKK